jgi:hypothetical protein
MAGILEEMKYESGYQVFGRLRMTKSDALGSLEGI